MKLKKDRRLIVKLFHGFQDEMTPNERGVFFNAFFCSMQHAEEGTGEMWF